MLSALIWIPFVGAIVVGCLPKTIPAHRIKLGSLIWSGATLLWTIWLMSQFDLSRAEFQFQETLPWLETLGLNYELGIDGLSLPLLVLNSLLTWIAIYSSREQTERHRLFYGLVFLVSSGVAGALLAQNLLLFFLFYELELIPFYLLVSVWGGKYSNYAATKFLLYTATSGILILAGFLGLVWLSNATSFSYSALLEQSLPLNIQFIPAGGSTNRLWH